MATGLLPPSYQKGQCPFSSQETKPKLVLGVCDQRGATAHRNTEGQKGTPPPRAKLSVRKFLWRGKTDETVREDSSPREIKLRARASKVGARNFFPSPDRPVLSVYSCWHRVRTQIQSYIVLPGARFSHSTALLQTLAFSIHSQQATLGKALGHTCNTLGGSWQTCVHLTPKSTESRWQGSSTLYVLRADAAPAETLVSANKQLSKTATEIPEGFLSERNATSLMSSGGAETPQIIFRLQMF